MGRRSDGALRPNRGALCRTYRVGLRRLPRRVVFREGFGSAGGAAATCEQRNAVPLGVDELRNHAVTGHVGDRVVDRSTCRDGKVKSRRDIGDSEVDPCTGFARDIALAASKSSRRARRAFSVRKERHLVAVDLARLERDLEHPFVEHACSLHVGDGNLEVDEGIHGESKWRRVVARRRINLSGPANRTLGLQRSCDGRVRARPDGTRPLEGRFAQPGSGRIGLPLGLHLSEGLGFTACTQVSRSGE